MMRQSTERKPIRQAAAANGLDASLILSFVIQRDVGWPCPTAAMLKTIPK
jgi:hypothetical protein